MNWLEKNLEAMRRWTPRGADRVGAATIPAGFESAVGTDGTRTFLRVHTGERRRLEWLGGTSMPRGGAEGMVANLVAGTVNGMGLSIGTGYEWKTFTRKLSTNQALFVYEPDAVAARMALTICDLVAELASGQIVLLVGEQMRGGELAGFLREHVGYEPPAVLHPLASLTGERRTELFKTAEAIVRLAVTERATLVQELLGKRQQSKPENVVAFVQAERYRGEKPLRDELEREGRGDRPVRQVRLDSFTSCSVAMRLKVLAETSARKIVGDYFRGQLGRGVPEDVCVETWVPPLVGAGYWQADRFAGVGRGGANDRVVVHAGVHRELLASLGVPLGQIDLRPIVREAIVVGSVRPRPEAKRVAVIGDLPAMDLVTLGIELPTHQEIFVAARAIVEEEYLTVHFHSAADVLRRALARAKVTGNDDALAERMLRIIRDALIPSVPLLTLAKKLREEKFDVELVGEWPGMQSSTNWAPAWEKVGVLVHLSPWGVVSPLVMEAVAVGVRIVAPEHPSDKQAGSLPLAKVSVRQLIPSIKRFLKENACP
ncbi:MAG: hypothetical protein FWD61_02090 [Phycisphaerales bacterium]|nr:hypothetical protein [Phycisphaerales bacterium]